MAKKDVGIRQVLEFAVVGPDDKGLPNELAENPVITAPGSAETETSETIETPENDPYQGPRQWVAKWFGPFFSAALPAKYASGLYLIYVGNYPLFVSSSANIFIALTRHLMFSGHQIIPIDLLGREILHYAHLYKQPLSIKTALLFENNKLIHPKEHIHCYRRAAAALAYCHAIPCNKYARLSYEFAPLTLTNLGKRFPLRESFHAEDLQRKEENDDGTHQD